MKLYLLRNIILTWLKMDINKLRCKEGDLVKVIDKKAPQYGEYGEVKLIAKVNGIIVGINVTFTIEEDWPEDTYRYYESQIIVVTLKERILRLIKAVYV